MGVKRLLLCLAIFAFLKGGNGSRSAALDELVTSAMCSFRKHLSRGWAEIGVPPLDPVGIPLLGLPDNIDKITTYGQYTAMNAKGLADFAIEDVDSNVLFMRTAIRLNVPSLEITGSHVTLGESSSEIQNVLIGIGVTFTLAEEELLLEVDEVDVLFDFKFDGKSSEGERLAEDEIVDLLKVTYQGYFEKAIAYEITAAIEATGEDDDYENGDSIDDFFDRLFADIRQLILENNLDPMHLPQDSDNFTLTLFNTTVDGSVTVHKGSLGGLSTLHRAGNMSARFIGLKAEIIWDGEVGFDDLEIDYSFDLNFPLFGKELTYAIKMSYVHLSFETDVFVLRQNITLARCNITELGPIHYKEKGAGPLDTPMYNLLVNTFLGSLHHYVMKIGEGVVCSLLEDVLSHV
ncbi:uncharacterized protein LOC135220954 [Macrobrachium nipponense]|uniref:uncharacterized protein LOC135220954 n=1 Tax=Macrobrachium nipponense TaxID=159736 RepID=UPI0030C8250C